MTGGARDTHSDMKVVAEWYGLSDRRMRRDVCWDCKLRALRLLRSRLIVPNCGNKSRVAENEDSDNSEPRLHRRLPRIMKACAAPLRIDRRPLARSCFPGPVK